MHSGRKTLVGLMFLGVAGAAAAQPPVSGFQERMKAALQAYEAKQYVQMERHLRAALAERPAHPRALYNLASALALRGQKSAAMDALEALDRMALSYDVSKDPDFTSLREERRFKDVRDRLLRNRRPAGDADVLFKLASPTFIPEGIAYDPDRKEYFVGSVYERRIVRVRRGKEQPFVAEAAGGLWAPLGMAVDRERKLLWVATAALPEMRNAAPGEVGQAALVAFELESGAQKHKYLVPGQGGRHTLDDLVVVKDGKIYATDSAAGALYEIDPATGQFTTLTEPGELVSPQGLTLTGDRKALYVADYAQGIFRLDIADRLLVRVDVASDICVYGIDGLYRHENELVAVQNGVRPHRIVRFLVDKGGRRIRHARVEAQNLEEFDEPTLGVIVGDDFVFVANSQWNKFDKDRQLPPADKLKGPIVMELPLPEVRRRDDRERRRDRSSPGGGGAPVQQPPAQPPLPVPAVPLPRL